MSMQKKIAALAMMAALMPTSGYGTINNITPEDIDTTPKEPPVPKGCVKYYFNANGDFFYARDEHTVFECVALTFKSAQKKFRKTQPPNTNNI